MHGAIGPGGVGWVMSELVGMGVDKQFVGVEAVALRVHVRDKAAAGTLGPIARIMPVRPPGAIPVIHQRGDASSLQRGYRYRTGEDIRSTVCPERKAHHLWGTHR